MLIYVVCVEIKVKCSAPFFQTDLDVPGGSQQQSGSHATPSVSYPLDPLLHSQYLMPLLGPQPQYTSAAVPANQISQPGYTDMTSTLGPSRLIQKNNSSADIVYGNCVRLYSNVSMVTVSRITVSMVTVSIVTVCIVTVSMVIVSIVTVYRITVSMVTVSMVAVSMVTVYGLNNSQTNSRK